MQCSNDIVKHREVEMNEGKKHTKTIQKLEGIWCAIVLVYAWNLEQPVSCRMHMRIQPCWVMMKLCADRKAINIVFIPFCQTNRRNNNNNRKCWMVFVGEFEKQKKKLCNIIKTVGCNWMSILMLIVSIVKTQCQRMYAKRQRKGKKKTLFRLNNFILLRWCIYQHSTT